MTQVAQVKQAKKAKQGKVHKFGRHSRAPSNANQTLRSARNKRKRIEKFAALMARITTGWTKPMRKARGTARRHARHGMTRQGSPQVQA